MTDEESYRSELAELKKLNDRRVETRHSLVKYVISLAAGSLIVITSFHDKTGTSPYNKDFYILSISLIAFGILTLALSLYGDTVALRRSAEGNWVYLQKRYVQKDTTAKPYNEPKHKFYEYSEIIGFLSLLLAVVSFAVLAILAY